MKVLLKFTALVLVMVLFIGLNQRFLVKSYNDTVMYGSFTQKRARAETIDTEKIIIAGGSASNLGFNSKYFEQISGKPAINLSISAGVPLKIYMKAAELCANPGDTIILPLEYNYYSAEFDEMSESYIDMVEVDSDLKCDETLYNDIEFFTMRCLRSFTRINDCILFSIRDYMNTENTIYVANSIDEYGDFCLHKDRTPTYSSVPKLENFEYNTQTLYEINNFIEKMRKKDVMVYLTFPCMDKGHCVNYEQYSKEVQQVVSQYIPTEHILGTPEDFGFDEDFFFDTAFHIQYKNREIYTEKLYFVYSKTAE